MGWMVRRLVAGLLLLGSPAAAVELDGALIQGGLVRGSVAPGSEVRLDERKVRVDGEGRFILGFGRDAGPRAVLTVRAPGGSTERTELEIEARRYEIERIDGLPPKKVTPPPEVLDRIRADHLLFVEAKRRDSALPHFAAEPVWPTVGPITGIYGSQRILNGEPRSPHRGVDIAAPRGTAIRAMADGVVSIAEADLYFTGGTVMIDHGHGLHSLYVHLDQVWVEADAELQQGDPIGTVGATGRVTGPHLHWGIYWFDQALDPMLLVGPMPES